MMFTTSCCSLPAACRQVQTHNIEQFELSGLHTDSQLSQERLRTPLCASGPVFQLEAHFWLKFEGVVLQDLLYQLICICILCKSSQSSFNNACNHTLPLQGCPRLEPTVANLSSPGCLPPGEQQVLQMHDSCPTKSAHTQGARRPYTPPRHDLELRHRVGPNHGLFGLT